MSSAIPPPSPPPPSPPPCPTCSPHRYLPYPYPSTHPFPSSPTQLHEPPPSPFDCCHSPSSPVNKADGTRVAMESAFGRGQELACKRVVDGLHNNLARRGGGGANTLWRGLSARLNTVQTVDTTKEKHKTLTHTPNI